MLTSFRGTDLRKKGQRDRESSNKIFENRRNATIILFYFYFYLVKEYSILSGLDGCENAKVKII